MPLVVKPAQGGSAQGVTIVEDRANLPRAMVDAYTYGDVALVEQRITGTEIAVGIIDTGDGPVALPAVEIEPLSGVYSFEARYNAGETRFYVPARISRRGGRDARREAALDRPPRARPAPHLARRPHRRRRGHAVVPRGERAARAHRDLAAPAGARGGRATTSAGSTRRWPRPRSATTR